MNLLEYFGKFHLLIIHLPLGILMGFLVLGLAIPRKKLHNSHQVIRVLLLVSALSATLSCITGILLSGLTDYDYRLLFSHRIMGIALAVINWVIYIDLKKLMDASPWVYYSALAATLALAVVTGHLGGSLTHGSEFLNPPKPDEWFNSSSDSDEPITLQSTAWEAASTIFEAKCNSCHGESKQKGGLRLDTPKGFAEGGKSGILADQNESLLMYRILLPKEEKKHMPPKERSQLTAAEIGYLDWWIKTGPENDKSLSELSLPDSLHEILTDENEKGSHSWVPNEEAQPADQAIVEKLRSYNALIVPVSKQSNYLSVSFMNVLSEQIPDALSELEKLLQQVIWLNLDYHSLESLQWEKIYRLKKLRKLSVKNSNLSDETLEGMKVLEFLVYLNLVGTEVTARGVGNLLNSNKLETVYLYDTNIERNEFLALKKEHADIAINWGNYQVPILKSDTTVLRGK